MPIHKPCHVQTAEPGQEYFSNHQNGGHTQLHHRQGPGAFELRYVAVQDIPHLLCATLLYIWWDNGLLEFQAEDVQPPDEVRPLVSVV